MKLTLSLSAEAEARLRQRAAAEGADPAVYASKLIEQAVTRPSLEELLAPLGQEFAASGASDEQLVEQITEARDALSVS